MRPRSCPSKVARLLVTTQMRFGLTMKTLPAGVRPVNDYEVSRNGRRFLFILDGPQPPGRQAQIVVVQGWRGEVAARLAERR
jgi:hypothetical protein